MPQSPLPTSDAIEALVGMLLGKKIRAVKGAPLVPKSIGAVATYLDANGVPAFTAFTDVAFVAGVGAALAMVPIAVVNEAIKSGKPSEALVDNAYEVLNVAASLFNDIEDALVHVKLDKRLHLGAPNPEMSKRLVKPAARMDFDIKIPGYPDGKLSLLAA